MTSADYAEKIPNNVGLREDRRLQRALESWQPNFLTWWESMGPTLPTQDVYLRTAINVGRAGWANFGHVAMKDYRWGIFLAERDPDRRIGFGEHRGEPAWQQVPGEYRAELRRLIVIQGDTEPASVEQQRNLGATAPSLYDLRNLFQVNVEEGRHLWAMVYLLHAHFGREGREEAEELLHRNSGSQDSPRILGDGGKRHRRRGRARGRPAAGDPEVPELPLQRLARPVRRRDLHQRGQLLHRRAEGPLDGGAPQGRPPAGRRRDHGRLAGRGPDRPDRGVRADRPQHRPAARVHRRLPGRGQALEQDPGRGGPGPPAEAPARGVQP